MPAVRQRPVYDSDDNESPTDTEEQDDTQFTEEEQWKIINQTGIFNSANSPLAQVDEPIPGDGIFNAMMLIMPFSSLLYMFDILIHQQYGRTLTWHEIWDRMAPGIPILSILIHYTTRYKHTLWMQAIFFLVSVVVGPRMVWIINRASWLVNMKQAPPLATLWVYTIVQLNLLPSVISLTCVCGWIWWTGMKLFM